MNGAQGQMVYPSGFSGESRRVILTLAAVFLLNLTGVNNQTWQCKQLSWGRLSPQGSDLTWLGLRQGNAGYLGGKYILSKLEAWPTRKPLTVAWFASNTFADIKFLVGKWHRVFWSIVLTYSLNYYFIFWRNVGGDVLLLCPVPVNVCFSYLLIDKCSFCHAMELNASTFQTLLS